MLTRWTTWQLFPGLFSLIWVMGACSSAGDGGGDDNTPTPAEVSPSQVTVSSTPTDETITAIVEVTSPADTTPTPTPLPVAGTPTPRLGTPAPDVLPHDACRSDEDCTPSSGYGDYAGPSYCVGPDEEAPATYCGEPFDDTCGADQHCPTGYICEQQIIDSGCILPDNTVKQCVPGCDPLDPAACGEQERCNADTLRCELISCTEGTFTCPDNFECVGESGGNDCQRIWCGKSRPTDAAANCPQGSICANDGYCYTSGCQQVPAPCDGPEYLACMDVPSDGGYTCIRKLCTVDSDCGFDEGLCVEGECSSTFGYCGEEIHGY